MEIFTRVGGFGRRLLRWTVCTVIVGLGGLAAGQAVYPEIQSLVVFGDGLSDTGRGGGVDTSPPELVWVDYLAGLLGVPEAAPYNVTTNPAGRNFAHFGATAGVAEFNPFPDGSDQIDSYLIDELAGAAPPADALLVIWLGTWDVANLAEGGSDSGADVADELVALIRRLADAGGKQFLVPDLFPVEMSPDFLSQPEPVATLTAEFNQRLAVQLENLRGLYPDVRFLGMRTYDLFLDIAAAPAVYGFEELDTIPFLSAEDYSIYLWWDYLYPTSIAHDYIAELAAYEIGAALGGLSGADVDLEWAWNGALSRWELQLAGPALDVLTLEVSQDLETWQPVATFTRFDGDEVYAPAAVPTVSTYYRAR